MREYIARHLVEAVVEGGSRRKQELGQALAEHLGFQPGPLGPDGGVDGAVYDEDGRLYHFQSKLSRRPLGREEARAYHSDLVYHGAYGGVYLSGDRYVETFERRLWGHPGMEAMRGRVHLLTLLDVLLETPTYEAATKAVPTLTSLAQIEWARFRD